MDKKTVFIKTAKGEHDAANLSSDLKRILSLIDNKSRADELSKRAPPSLRDSWYEILEELVNGGYIADKDKPQGEPKIAVPKMAMPKMATPKIATPKIATPKFNPLSTLEPTQPLDDLDFNTVRPASASNAAELAARQQAEERAAKQKADEAARARAELEAAMAAAKIKAQQEAAAKAEAKARQEAEAAARARAAAELKAKQEAVIREQAEAKAKQEAAARMHAEQEAARAKAALEAAARAKIEAEMRVRAEIEAAARAQQEAEAKAKREAEAARLKAEQEAARIKAELEAAAKAKAEAEAARIKAEEEAARVRAELEAARARAEAEARALAEARAKQAAEEKARQEAEAARIKAEQEAEAARLRAEQEAEAARVRAEQEAARIRAEQEAEAARLKAEQELARIRAEQEAAARARAEAEARASAEEQARQQAAAAARQAAERAEQERAAEQAAELAAAAKASAAPVETPSFEIKLDEFLGAPAQPVTKAAPRVEAPQVPNVDEAAQRAREEAEAAAQAAAAAAAKAAAEQSQTRNVAAEMARLKEEAEAARRQAEEEARRQAEEQALAEEQAKAWAEAEQRAKAQEAIEAEQAAQQAALAQAKAAQKPVSRERRKPLPLGKIAFALIVLALVTVLALPYVYPLKEYVAPLEQQLSAQFKQPVHIGGMSATSLPPRLRLQNVTLGGAQEIKVASVVLNFDAFSLLSETKVISNAELQDVTIDGRDLSKQAAMLKLMGGNVRFPVRHVDLHKIKIVTDQLTVPNLSGVGDIDAQGQFSRVSLHSEDDKLGVDLQANQGRWQVSVNLKESALPILPGLVFSDLSAKGNLADGEVNFTELDAHILNGILLGSGKLSWRTNWQLQGHLEAKTFELDKMMSGKSRISGDMYGEATFSMAADKLAQLGEAPRLEGSFNVKSGTISGFDMVETARLQARENLRGGRTNFDELIGLVQLDSHMLHFRQVKIVSSMLSATGSFDVLPEGDLTGTFNGEIKMRSGNNLLTLYGSLTEPKMRAGR